MLLVRYSYASRQIFTLLQPGLITKDLQWLHDVCRKLHGPTFVSRGGIVQRPADCQGAPLVPLVLDALRRGVTEQRIGL